MGKIEDDDVTYYMSRRFLVSLRSNLARRGGYWSRPLAMQNEGRSAPSRPYVTIICFVYESLVIIFLVLGFSCLPSLHVLNDVCVD